ncbi:nuclear transport factor 2 family protein [Streptomyces lincolnensis]|uniref:nuclear transport factor 2 family protein n=1 Tax=Streptomyces lincolnensis TaxID=1915 RepID=UPI001E452DD4|nr:nuclear transport factor 2 family protein [Streptomyces lincolnensis]MCD7445207.1 nuclear transport factor 2 family protein [Streptomyces lincolnensis]
MSETLQSAAATTVARWRSAEERGDVDAAVACLSPDVVLSSPLTDQFRFEGSDQLRDFLTVAFKAVKDVHYHTQTGEGDTYALVYRARVGSQSFEEVQLLRLDDQARITEITLFGRPMPALTALMHLMGPALARQQGRRGLATLISVSTIPIHAMVSSGDRSMVAKTRPAAR